MSMPKEFTGSETGGALCLPGKLTHFLWKKFAIAGDEQKYPADITNQERCKISGKKVGSSLCMKPIKSPVTISQPTSKE